MWRPWWSISLQDLLGSRNGEWNPNSFLAILPRRMRLKATGFWGAWFLAKTHFGHPQVARTIARQLSQGSTPWGTFHSPSTSSIPCRLILSSRVPCSVAIAGICSDALKHSGTNQLHELSTFVVWSLVGCFCLQLVTFVPAISVWMSVNSLTQRQAPNAGKPSVASPSYRRTT